MTITSGSIEKENWHWLFTLKILRHSMYPRHLQWKQDLNSKTNKTRSSFYRSFEKDVDMQINAMSLENSVNIYISEAYRGTYRAL